METITNDDNIRAWSSVSREMSEELATTAMQHAVLFSIPYCLDILAMLRGDILSMLAAVLAIYALCLLCVAQRWRV